MADDANWRAIRIVDRVAGRGAVKKMSLTIWPNVATHDSRPAIARFAAHADHYRCENECIS